MYVGRTRLSTYLSISTVVEHLTSSFSCFWYCFSHNHDNAWSMKNDKKFISLRTCLRRKRHVISSCDLMSLVYTSLDLFTLLFFPLSTSISIQIDCWWNSFLFISNNSSQCRFLSFFPIALRSRFCFLSFFRSPTLFFDEACCGFLFSLHSFLSLVRSLSLLLLKLLSLSLSLCLSVRLFYRKYSLSQFSNHTHA